MDRLVDHVLQKTYDAILHSIENMDSMHKELLLRFEHRRRYRSFNVKGPPLLTDYQRKRVHAFFDSVLCLGYGQMTEASENHEHIGAAQREQMSCKKNIDVNDSDFEFHAMPSAKSAESLHNLKSMKQGISQTVQNCDDLRIIC